ncbi:MAG: prolyl oligopeptidase family serine peptidase [Candidatus Eisenbacteria bacterium]|nr:prolyl oligopeptidase family serine peptidase [Candidatus Eisenbacteria bacterium]
MYSHVRHDFNGNGRNKRGSHEKSLWIFGKSSFVVLSIALLSCLVWALALAQGEAYRKPPDTRQIEVRDVLHGKEIVDPYRWLEDQESPETRAWIDAQNAYSHSLIDSLKVREKIRQRLTELMKIERITMPSEHGGRYFFYKRSPDQDQYVLYMRRGPEGEDEVLIDPNTMSADKTKSVELQDVSKDGTILAYGIRDGGQDEVAVRLFNVDTKCDLPDTLTRGLYFSLSIPPDKSGFYYSRHGEEGSRVYYHKMGSNPSDDVKIFGDGYGPDKGIGAVVSEDGRYLVIDVAYGSAGQKTDIFYQDLTEKGPIRTFVDDVEARFEPHLAGDKVFILTDWNAPKGRVLVADVKNPRRENWKEIIPEGSAVIEGMSLAGGRLFINYLDNVVSKIKVFDPDGKFLREISLPALGSVSGVAGWWESNEAFFSFTSFHVPPTIYRYDVGKGTQTVWAQLKVPVKTDMFEVKQVWYASKDSTKIPMFLVYKKGMRLDGQNPTFLTGYGGFDVSMTPYYSSVGVLWIENGGVYAVPNLRGGAEFGEEWHRAGMFDKKQNVFDDFIAAAEWLTANKYTNPSKLAISGGSNGGLLVGAAEVQRPDLFRAVVCTYPLLDMLRYDQFLLGKFWVSEYGSASDPEQFKYIYAYSPYQNVKKGVEYPATLFITGDSDTRVAPLHARKMTAMVQSATGSDKPVLLLYDTKLGHSGGQPLNKQIDDLTDEMGFLFWQLGMGN